MRIVFMGTPHLAAEVLSFLITEYEVVGVVSQPGKPLGRSQVTTESPVAQLAKKSDIPLITPTKLDEAALETLTQWQPDLIIVAAYGKILRSSVLNLPPLGCLNIHYSLLPKFRGASPIQEALLQGESSTGVTLMKMDEGLDTGPIYATKSLSVDPNDTTLSLTPKLSLLAKELLSEALPILSTITPTPQDNSQASHCSLIAREDGEVDWNRSAETLYNRYRAFTPWPGLFTWYHNNDKLLRLKLTNIRGVDTSLSGTAGQVHAHTEGIAITTPSGALLIDQVQLEGKPATDIRNFLNGHPKFIGSILG